MGSAYECCVSRESVPASVVETWLARPVILSFELGLIASCFYGPLVGKLTFWVSGILRTTAP